VVPPSLTGKALERLRILEEAYEKDKEEIRLLRDRIEKYEHVLLQLREREKNELKSDCM
jgi:hypothetical protein